MISTDPSVLEAMELWQQSRRLCPRTDLNKILDIEGQRMHLDVLHDRILYSQWGDEQVPEKICLEFIAGVARWCSVVFTEILHNGFSV